MISTGRTTAFQGIAQEAGTKWLKEKHAELVASGGTDLSFRAWAAEMGIVVSPDSGFDDTRRRRVLSLDSLLSEGDNDRAPFDQTRIKKLQPSGRKGR